MKDEKERFVRNSNPYMLILELFLKRHLRIVVIHFILVLLFFRPSFSQTSPYTDRDCLFCHEKPNISQIMANGKVRSLYVDPEEWSQDVHHKGKINCVDCHANANPYLHFREGFIDVDCARCHPEEAEEYQKNIHLTFAVPSAGKELPLCYHCHTKHHVLRHDDPASSVHEKNIGETCLQCHAEVMVKGITKGASLGKISGHRKGDLGEKFDMNVCISCHYEDSAHGAKRAYKEFCSRCHDVRTKGNVLMGPTHISSKRWIWLSSADSGIVALLVVSVFIFWGVRSRKKVLGRFKKWQETMRIKEKETPKSEEKDEVKNEKG